MGFLTKALVPNCNLESAGHKWIIEVAGRTVIGSPYDRPVERVGDQGCFTSIKPFYYESPFGWTGGSSTITIAQSGSGTSFPGGVIRVREIPYRATTNERGASGKVFMSGNLTAGMNVSFTSNCPILATEKLVTHREFYVSLSDEFGNALPYFFWQRIPYTTTVAGDVTTASSFSLTELQNRRELESGGETGQFPSVISAAYRFGRMWGAGQTTRLPLDSNIVFTNGSNVVTMTGNNVFKEADMYRSIVYTGPSTTVDGHYYPQNEALAFISLILSPTQATIVFPDPNVTTWPNVAFTMINGTTAATSTFTFSGRGKSDLYCTPVYIGEPFGGLSNGNVQWTPLNTIRDINLYEKAGRAVFVAEAGPSLVIGYERGITLMRASFSTDNPPQPEFIPLSDEVGSMNPKSFGGDNDRNIWFQANGRWWIVSGSRVLDVSKTMGVASFARKFLYGVSGATLKDQRVAFNSERNSFLVVGLSRAGDTTDHTYGAMICLDGPTPTLHPLRFPVPIHCACTVPREYLGFQFNQWFLGGDDGQIFTFEDPTAVTDTYYLTVGGSLQNTNIPYFVETGDIVFDWKARVKSIGLIFENDYTDYTIKATLKGSITANSFHVNTKVTLQLTKDQLDKEQPTFNQIVLRMARIRIEGEAPTNTGGTGLFKIVITTDQIAKD